MTLMTGFRPLREFMTLRDAVDRLFDDSFASSGGWYNLTGSGRFLPVDVFETPDEIVVRAQVPGVTPDNLEISYQLGILTLRATTPEQPNNDGWRWYVREIGAGEVARQITLPREIDVDNATARFENGVLVLTLPKSPSAKPRRIEINAGQNGAQQQLTATAES
jgi:HSP20 family protein